jgi:hypothetical protein
MVLCTGPAMYILVYFSIRYIREKN